MAKDFVKLSEVAVLEEVSENATVLVEENGEIYRAPKTSVGGGGTGGIKTAIIRVSNYPYALESVKSLKVARPSYECINMTFEEAYEIMSNGEPLMVAGMLVNNYPICSYGEVIFLEERMGQPSIGFMFNTIANGNNVIRLVWNATGLEEELPS